MAVAGCPVPAGVGIGWRSEVAADLLADPGVVDLVEITAEACYAHAASRREALAVAKKYLAGENRQLSCPGVYELCQQAGDFTGLADAAKTRGDGVSFLAGLIAGTKASGVASATR